MTKKHATYLYGLVSIAAIGFLLIGAVRAQSSRATTGPALPRLFGMMAAPAQEASQENLAEKESGEPQKEEGSPWQEAFHWFNFLIIVGGIVYMVKKLLIPFFEERGKLIRKDMEESKKTMADADQRLAAVENQLKHLDEELAALRAAASQEALAERQRIEQTAAGDAAKILAAAEHEIDAAAKAARQQLKQYATELAIGMAESKIRASLTPQSEERLLRTFVTDLTSATNGEAGSGTPGKQS